MDDDVSGISDANLVPRVVVFTPANYRDPRTVTLMVNEDLRGEDRFENLDLVYRHSTTSEDPRYNDQIVNLTEWIRVEDEDIIVEFKDILDVENLEDDLFSGIQRGCAFEDPTKKFGYSMEIKGESLFPIEVEVQALCAGHSCNDDREDIGMTCDIQEGLYNCVDGLPDGMMRFTLNASKRRLQKVWLKVLPDEIGEAVQEHHMLVHRMTSADEHFDGVVKNRSLCIEDRDAIVSVGEFCHDSYTVQIKGAPSEDVTVNIEASGGIQVDPTSITFSVDDTANAKRTVLLYSKKTSALSSSLPAASISQDQADGDEGCKQDGAEVFLIHRITSDDDRYDSKEVIERQLYDLQATVSEPEYLTNASSNCALDSSLSTSQLATRSSSSCAFTVGKFAVRVPIVQPPQGGSAVVGALSGGVAAAIFFAAALVFFTHKRRKVKYVNHLILTLTIEDVPDEKPDDARQRILRIGRSLIERVVYTEMKTCANLGALTSYGKEKYEEMSNIQCKIVTSTKARATNLKRNKIRTKHSEVTDARLPKDTKVEVDFGHDLSQQKPQRYTKFGRTRSASNSPPMLQDKQLPDGHYIHNNREWYPAHVVGESDGDGRYTVEFSDVSFWEIKVEFKEKDGNKAQKQAEKIFTSIKKHVDAGSSVEYGALELGDHCQIHIKAPKTHKFSHASRRRSSTADKRRSRRGSFRRSISGSLSGTGIGARIRRSISMSGKRESTRPVQLDAVRESGEKNPMYEEEQKEQNLGGDLDIESSVETSGSVINTDDRPANDIVHSVDRKVSISVGEKGVVENPMSTPTAISDPKARKISIVGIDAIGENPMAKGAASLHKPSTKTKRASTLKDTSRKSGRTFGFAKKLDKTPEGAQDSEGIELQPLNVQHDLASSANAPQEAVLDGTISSSAESKLPRVNSEATKRASLASPQGDLQSLFEGPGSSSDADSTDKPASRKSSARQSTLGKLARKLTGRKSLRENDPGAVDEEPILTLPEGWKKHYSEEHGHDFYNNKKLKRKVWSVAEAIAISKGAEQNSKEALKERRTTTTHAEQSVLQQRKKFAAGGRLDSFKTQKDRLQQQRGTTDEPIYKHGATGMQHDQMSNLHANARDALKKTADPLTHHHNPHDNATQFQGHEEVHRNVADATRAYQIGPGGRRIYNNTWKPPKSRGRGHAQAGGGAGGKVKLFKVKGGEAQQHREGGRGPGQSNTASI
jgi:hypothetical protein